jgi:hypothetical protein
MHRQAIAGLEWRDAETPDYPGLGIASASTGSRELLNPAA